MVNKKAFMRTLEVAIAAVITFIFVIYLIPDFNQKNPDNSIDILSSLKSNPDFIRCSLSKDQPCVEGFIRSNLPARYDFKVLLTSDPKKAVDDLPTVQVYVDSLFLSGDPNVIIKVYYWIR